MPAEFVTPQSAEQEQRLLQVVTGTTVVLLGMSLRIWGLGGKFPTVPLLHIGQSIPGWLDVAIFAAVVSGLAVLFGSDERTRTISRAVAFGLAVCGWGAVVVNQQRLQPWWQFTLLIILIFAVSSRPGETLRRTRWLVVSLYIFSAVSKLDHSFITQHGQVFLNALLSIVRLEEIRISEPVRYALAAGFPIGELLVGVGLLNRRTRRLALYGAIAMHVGLLVTLGPWGLRHRPPVLVWNLMFIVVDWILFAAPSDTHAAARPIELPPEPRRPFASRFREFAILLLLGLPVLEWFHFYDHWPGWALYASRPEFVRVEIRLDAVDKLPAHLRRHLGEPAPLSDWMPLRLDRWALEDTGLPMYPANRFAWAAALEIARRHKLDDGIRATAYGPANRLTGKREHSTHVGIDEMKEYAKSFRLNASEAR